MNTTATLLVQLERDRCEAMIQGDAARLAQLMHPDLFHVHAKGNVEHYDSYVGSALLKSTFTSLRRFDDLQVRVFGNAALMTGRQLAESVRKATGEHVRIDSMVTQVWALDGERWRQLSYQTTPIEMTVTPAA
jgi:ketosteroid isomerase-like protein